MDVLSAGEEAAGLWHLITIFAVGTDAEGDGSNANYESAHDGSVGLPVGRSRPPTTYSQKLRELFVSSSLNAKFRGTHQLGTTPPWGKDIYHHRPTPIMIEILNQG